MAGEKSADEKNSYEKNSGEKSADEKSVGEKKDARDIDEILLSIAQGSKGDGEFRVPASNKQGQSRSPQFRIIPNWVDVAETIVASKKFPYRTPSDLYRHALVTHIQYLHKIGDLPDKVGGMVQKSLIVDELLKYEEFESEFNDMLQRMTDTVQKRTEFGDEPGARRMVSSIYDVIMDMPDEGQRKMYSEIIRNRFGHLLEPDKGSKKGSGKGSKKEVKPASLINFDEAPLPEEEYGSL